MRNSILLALLILSCNQTDISTAEPSFSESESKKEIDTFLDAWHQAAAVADEDVFFGSIEEGGIYLGTDKTERWTKEEFMDWGMKYFERDTAWAFTPFDRVTYFSENGEMAWFEEALDTWMGVCRGSGVLLKNDTSWKLAHYNLAVTIDNDKIDGFIELTSAEKD